MGACAVDPAEAEGEEAEGASVGAFEDAALSMLEDEDALGEDEAGGELEDEEEAVHVGGLADAAGVPVEAGGFVVAEAQLLVHAVAVLGAAGPGGVEVGDEQPGLVVGGGGTRRLGRARTTTNAELARTRNDSPPNRAYFPTVSEVR